MYPGNLKPKIQNQKSVNNKCCAFVHRTSDIVHYLIIIK
jgi:hypothetical protein